MKLKKIKALGFMISSLILLNCLQTQAFTLTTGSAGQGSIGWKSNNVTFDVDVSCSSYLSTVQSAINAASETWGNVPTSGLKVSLGNTVTMAGVITNYVGASASMYAPQGNPIVYCDANFAADSGLSAASIPGFAGAQNMNSDGQLVGVLLVLNVQSGAAANVTTLSPTIANVVLTHEIGHCLGIGHSADTNALMYYATGAGRQNVLAKDDIDAVTYLYPKQDVTGGLACSTVKSWQGPRQKNLNFWSIFRNLSGDLLLLAIFIMVIQYSRRKRQRYLTA